MYRNVMSLLKAAVCAAAVLAGAGLPAAEEENAARPDFAALYADYPDEIAEIFGSPVGKREFLDYCAARPDRFPDLLPEPYRQSQLANAAANYVREREIEFGAAKSGFLPTRERALAALEKRVAEMSAADRAKLDEALADMHVALEKYIDDLADDLAFRKSVAEQEFMDMLAARHKVTEEDVEALFEERKEVFAHDPDTYVNYVLHGAGDRQDGKSQLRERTMVDYELLNRLDAMADGDTSEPFDYKGKTLTVTKLALPEPVLSSGIRNRLREELQAERRGTADSSLHEMSKVKYNFKLPETGGVF